MGEGGVRPPAGRAVERFLGELESHIESTGIVTLVAEDRSRSLTATCQRRGTRVEYRSPVGNRARFASAVDEIVDGGWMVILYTVRHGPENADFPIREIRLYRLRRRQEEVSFRAVAPEESRRLYERYRPEDDPESGVMKTRFR